jgi:hypothetical protein
MPESSLTFEFSILLPIQHSTRSVRCRVPQVSRFETRASTAVSILGFKNPAPDRVFPITLVEGTPSVLEFASKDLVVLVHPFH